MDNRVSNSSSNTRSSKVNLTSLPTELHLSILAELDNGALLSLTSTNRYFNELRKAVLLQTSRIARQKAGKARRYDCARCLLWVRRWITCEGECYYDLRACSCRLFPPICLAYVGLVDKADESETDDMQESTSAAGISESGDEDPDGVHEEVRASGCKRNWVLSDTDDDTSDGNGIDERNGVGDCIDQEESNDEEDLGASVEPGEDSN